MKKLLLASLITLASHSTFAAEQKHADVVFAKANQLYSAKDYAAAFAELQRIAATGNAQAIYNLGSMTQHGLGTAKDEKKALQYFTEASNKGFGKASFELAQLYQHGKPNLGITKDTNKYKALLAVAAQQGSEEAIVELATLLFAQGQPKYDQQAIQYLRPLLQKNYFPAVHLKALYDLGVAEKNKNPILKQQAVASLQNLANQGHAPSLMVLGNMLANGNIIPQDLEKAKKIFTPLAASNYPHAKESLAKVDAALAAQKANPAPKK